MYTILKANQVHAVASVPHALCTFFLNFRHQRTSRGDSALGNEIYRVSARDARPNTIAQLAVWGCRTRNNSYYYKIF